MARIRRGELKHDEFVDSVDALVLFLEAHGRKVTAGAVVLVVVVVLAGGLYWYWRREEARASLALGQAMLTFEAPVEAGLPPLPGQKSTVFSSAREKYEAAAQAFAAVGEKDPWTSSARLARHYQAICQFELGEKQKAVEGLEELSRGYRREEAAVAKLHLAGLYREMGRREEAAQLYRELIANPTRTVPRVVAQMHLAELEAEANPAQARQLYGEVKRELSAPDIVSEIDRRLELLPPPPVPGAEESTSTTPAPSAAGR